MVETASISSRALRYDESTAQNKWRKKSKIGRIKGNSETNPTDAGGGDDSKNSTSQNASSPPRKDAPLFVLHIGPPKTGTTTVQWAGRQYPGLMKKDNFFFLGNQQNIPEKLLHEMVRNCRDGIEPACQAKWNEFGAIVKNHKKKNHNVFMSEEMLNICSVAQKENYSLWERLIPILDGWNVRIVYTYRRLHEWVPSKYHQAFSFDVPEHRKQFRDNWPDDGGRIISSFSSFFDSLMVKRAFQLPLAVLKRWRDRFPYAEIRVFDMHATTSTSQDKNTNGVFLREFFCQMMPEAERLCRHLTMQKSMDVMLLNPSTEKAHQFDMLAVGAYQKGLVKTKRTRKEVTEAAESHAKQSGFLQLSSFPLDCITEQQGELLLNQTLEYEKEMVPDEYYKSSFGEEEIRKQFAVAMESGKFCSVHVGKTLKHPKWQNFVEILQV